jgi:hypothetical protein
MRPSARVVAAIVVAGIAFLLYGATMLPGLDLGDSASFQVRAGSPIISPRDGYPLYFAVGSLFVRATGDEPARAMNLASAVFGAAACGLIAVVAAELAGSVVAGAAAALLFAGSYTFWSQAVIAEVYTLHVLLVTLTLLLLLHWSCMPTTGRLAWFFAIYAASFGNHLSMILLAPAYAAFLLAAGPGGWRGMLTPRTIALAGAFAALGAVQYLWNFSALWHAPVPPRDLLDAAKTFWFDVTKSDWRDTMVMRVSSSEFVERLWMYAFDVRQQFGVLVPPLAAIGAVQLIRTRPRHAVLVLAAYGAGVVFALGYNVGDAHVFFLQSHLMLALLVAPGLALIDRILPARGMAVALALILAGARIYGDYPALDRSNDRRPTEVLEALTSGLDERHAVLLSDLDWQLENGLNYFARETRPDFLYGRLADVMLYAPAFIRDNADAGRRIVVGDRARSHLEAAYGPLLSATRDESHPVTRLTDLIRGLPRGTPYVVCVLRPPRDFSLDEPDLNGGLRLLTGNAVTAPGSNDYTVVAGVLGAEPALSRSSRRPFRSTVSLGGVEVEVRMESWLAFDTIRRMGFGHVIAGHRRALIIERGVSFVAFDAGGRVARSGYTSGIFAPQPRFIVQLSR